jgi:predicted CopG family antitoxin
MAYKTINLKPSTYQRLVFYKHGSKSFDDVLNDFMDRISEDKFYEELLKEHNKRVKEVRAGEFVRAEDLDKAMDEL